MTPMMFDLLANAPAPDPMIPGQWVLALVGVLVSSILAGVLGKNMGKKEAVKELRVTPPVPTLTVEMAKRFAEKDELAALKADLDELKNDVDRKLDRLLEGQQERGKVAREALNNVHRRLDGQTEATSELKGEVHQISKNVERLLTLATTPKPSGR
jgi:hypothetical protein